MNPIFLSLLLGTAAAAANVLGGTIIVQRNWGRSYLKYFVALGAGFMLATAVLEIIPASFALREKDAPILILAGYLITHFFEHTVTPHFHFGEETHADQFIAAHKGYSVLLGPATFAGVLTMALWRRHVGIGLPLSGGVTIYVAASDLMPEVNREPGGKMALVVLLGVAIFFLLDRLVQ